MLEFSKYITFKSNDSFFENLKINYLKLQVNANAAKIAGVEQNMINKLSSMNTDHQDLQKIQDEKIVNLKTNQAIVKGVVTFNFILVLIVIAYLIKTNVTTNFVRRIVGVVTCV